MTSLQSKQRVSTFKGNKINRIMTTKELWSNKERRLNNKIKVTRVEPLNSGKTNFFEKYLWKKKHSAHMFIIYMMAYECWLLFKKMFHDLFFFLLLLYKRNVFLILLLYIFASGRMMTTTTVFLESFLNEFAAKVYF